MPTRKRSRLQWFDYATVGAYFVTICTRRRKEFFGFCVNHEVRPTAAACAVQRCWDAIPRHFPAVDIDAFVVMPNHVHGLLLLGDGAPTLSAVVGSFKSAATREVNGLQVSRSDRLWQRGYHERIVRSEEELEAIRRYIIDNPSAWTADPENPARSRVVASAPWL